MDNGLNARRGLTETDRLRQERDHFRILVEVTNAVISRQNPAELMAEIASPLRDFFGVAYLSLDLLDPASQLLHCHSVYFPGGNLCQQATAEVPLSKAFVSQIFQSKALLLADSAELKRLGASSEQASHLDARGFHCSCALPLIAGQRVLGVLNLAHHRPDAFPADHLNLLQEIAARIAIGMENALAYKEISRLKDRLANENLYLSEEIRNAGSFGEIIGDSPTMRAVLEQVEMVADSDCTVLILGETGTGKELIARAIHNLSARQTNTMVKVNCAAIPAGLLESDLFGHEKGAFTGATSQRLGRFELADKGTLFLDEVGDIPLALQPKLLRALQEREVERLGGQRVIPVDARLIAATNRDLTQMVAEREFRSDLYYRLNVFPIVVPPLRERPADIPRLAHYFMHKFGQRMRRQIDSIPAETLQCLQQLPWPGNVRELENVIERAVILTRGPVLNLPPNELQYHLAPVASRKHTPSSLAEFLETPALADASASEREKIIRVLRETNGIVAGPRGAAARLGLKRTTLLSRMQRLGISSRELVTPAAPEGEES